MIFLFPVFFLGLPFLLGFLRSAWPIALLFFLILLGLDAFYLTNRQLFKLLEREDWPAIVLYLEKRVIQKGRYSSWMVQLLGNAYLVLADTDGALKLENMVAMARPPLLEAHGLLFGAARVLGKDFTGAARFFQERLAGAAKSMAKRRFRRKSDDQWLWWYYGFSMLLDRKYQEAADCFTDIALTGTLGLPTGLAAYFLFETLWRVLILEREEMLALALKGKSRAQGMLKTRDDWLNELEKYKTEVYIVVLARFIRDAAQWLYD